VLDPALPEVATAIDHARITLERLGVHSLSAFIERTATGAAAGG